MKRDIVHVLSRLNRGGIETWLMMVLRTNVAIRNRTRICLVGHNDWRHDNYVDEIYGMGIPIDHVESTIYGTTLPFKMGSFLQRIKPTVVHSHLNYLSGFVTLGAFWAQVPTRIAHYHIAYPPRHKRFYRRGYIDIVRRLEARTATHIIGCSKFALDSYRQYSNDPERCVLYCGIDLAPFSEKPDRAVVRNEIGIPFDAYVVGHVGRFDEQKNHRFFIEIASEFVALNNKAYFLLVGEGPLRSEIEKQVQDLGLASRFIFTGVRSDVPRLMMGAMDAFLFPSLYEGLPVTVIEAQSAGLPVLLSDTITKELVLKPDHLRFVNLSQSPTEWAAALQELVLSCNISTAKEYLEELSISNFNIKNSAELLSHIYNQ